METNDFLRDKFNEIEILKGKLITYPKECSKDIISKIDMLCDEIWGHIEKSNNKKHKDEHNDKDKNKEKVKVKDKNKHKEKCHDNKCYGDKCDKDKNKGHSSKKSEFELVDKFMKIYNGECQVCKSKEKRVRNLMRMIEDELENDLCSESVGQDKDRQNNNREFLKDLHDKMEFEKGKKKIRNIH